jgi:hypothetical protein
MPSIGVADEGVVRLKAGVLMELVPSIGTG